MQLPTLNYQPLQAQAGGLNAATHARRRLIQVAIYIVAVVLLLAFTHGAWHTFAVVVSIISVVIGLMAIGWLGTKRQAAIREALEQFAKTNNLGVEFDIKDPVLNGLMFQVGH